MIYKSFPNFSLLCSLTKSVLLILLFPFIFFESWRRSEQASPRCDALEWGLFWAQGNQDPEGSWERNFYFSLKEFILGDLPIMSYSKNNFLWHISIGQGKLLITKHLLLLSSYEWPSYLCETPRCLTSSLAPNAIHTSLSLSVSDLLMYVRSLALSFMWGSHTYVCNYIWFFSLVNLFHVDLILDQLEEPQRVELNLFLPHNQNKQPIWGRERETEAVSFRLKPPAVLQEAGNSLAHSTCKRGFTLVCCCSDFLKLTV